MLAPDSFNRGLAQFVDDEGTQEARAVLAHDADAFIFPELSTIRPFAWIGHPSSLSTYELRNGAKISHEFHELARKEERQFETFAQFVGHKCLKCVTHIRFDQ